ncbi:hypothetical protein HPP92_020546 [Vanilla planifolia]|uniref:Uncharacterized protein n=1 Tax=Vanilla planifolia TaxID=51239 RepID=A0A835Q7Z1_VANPL|nr:hypothetical protein HPP92_020546 [Vanilla planifolia]
MRPDCGASLRHSLLIFSCISYLGLQPFRRAIGVLSALRILPPVQVFTWMMSLLESSTSLLAACGGDTVKVFDVSVKSGDPCVLSYSPSPGSHVNSIKWNHTNLVVASAGEDKKDIIVAQNGQSMGILPLSNSNADDDLEESILSINFSNKKVRDIFALVGVVVLLEYGICSGALHQMVEWPYRYHYWSYVQLQRRTPGIYQS